VIRAQGMGVSSWAAGMGEGGSMCQPRCHHPAPATAGHSWPASRLARKLQSRCDGDKEVGHVKNSSERSEPSVCPGRQRGERWSHTYSPGNTMDPLGQGAKSWLAPLRRSPQQAERYPLPDSRKGCRSPGTQQRVSLGCAAKALSQCALCCTGTLQRRSQITVFWDARKKKDKKHTMLQHRLHTLTAPDHIG
jgi:hypothetical protein